MFAHKKYLDFVVIAVISIFFVISSYFSLIYQDDIEALIKHKSLFGVFLYIFVTTMAVVLAPVSTLPLVPVAAAIWGPIPASLMSIVGWMLGSWIAFEIARQYGHQVVCRIVRKENIQKWENFFPQSDLFWPVVIARIFLPVDLLSYVIGLLTPMKAGPYLLATLIGVTPFAFIFSYGARLPLGLQLFFLIIFVFFYLLFRKIKTDLR